jgi:hypothetical protein
LNCTAKTRRPSRREVGAQLGALGRARRAGHRRGGRGEDARGQAGVVRDDLVDVRGARGAQLLLGVQRVGHDLQPEGVRLRDDGRVDGPARRVPAVARGAGRGRPSGVHRLQRQQRGRQSGAAGDVEVRRPEGLHERLADRQARRPDRLHDGLREARPRLEVAVRRLVLDLDVQPRAGLAAEREDLGERRHRLAAVRRWRRGQAGVVAGASEHVDAAALAQVGRRDRRDRPGAVRRAVEGGVVQDHRHAVRGELDVELEDEALGGRGAEGGQRVLGVAGHAVAVGPAPVGVDGGGGERGRRGEQQRGQRGGEDAGGTVHAGHADVGSRRVRRQRMLDVAQALARLERGSATAGEREAAAWIAARLREQGLPVEVDEERAHGGYWWPLGLLNLLALAGALVRRRVLAALAVGLLVDDIDHRSRAFRRVLPRRETWNVTATAGDPDAERTVVVVAHHDAAHGGVIFDTSLIEAVGTRWPQVIARAKRWPPVMWGMVIGPLLVLAGRRRAGAAWCAGAAAVMADVGRTPVVPGANDNLSAVAVVLELARERFEGVRVLLVSTGSEESNAEGMQAWGRRRFGALDPERTAFVALETLGSGHLAIAESEGFLWQHRFDAALKDRAEACARAEGIEVWRGLRNSFASDGQIPLHAGFPTMLLGGLDDLKLPKNYHKPTDVPEALDLACMEDAVRLLAAFVRATARA